MQRNPFDEIEELFDRMGRQLETETLGELQAIPVDLRDHDEEYVLLADLPGYDVDDVDLTFADGSVRIEATRDTPDSEELDGEYRIRERSESVSRTVHVPEPVDEGDLTATFDDGTLSITLPKHHDETEGHTIDID
jgi:HSP20 family protein